MHDSIGGTTPLGRLFQTESKAILHLFFNVKLPVWSKQKAAIATCNGQTSGRHERPPDWQSKACDFRFPEAAADQYRLTNAQEPHSRQKLPCDYEG
jgi:hypothetical protein